MDNKTPSFTPFGPSQDSTEPASRVTRTDDAAANDRLRGQLLSFRAKQRAKKRQTKAKSRTKSAAVVNGLIYLAVVAFVLISAVATSIINPLDGWRHQRAEATELTERLSILEKEKLELHDSIVRLKTDEEIVRVARRDFNLVFPGEQAYAFRAAKEEPVSLPTSWPLSLLHDEVID